MPCAGSADTVQRGVLRSSAGVCDPQNDPVDVLYMGGCEWLSPAFRVLQRRRVSVSGGRVLHTQLVGSGQALVPAWSPGWAWAVDMAATEAWPSPLQPGRLGPQDAWVWEPSSPTLPTC